jgi:hypothetical protein
MGSQHSHHNRVDSTERIIASNTNSVATQTTVNYQTTQLPAQSVSYVQPTQYVLPTQYDFYAQNNQYTLPPQYTTNSYAQIEAFKTLDGVEKESENSKIPKYETVKDMTSLMYVFFTLLTIFFFHILFS